MVEHLFADDSVLWPLLILVSIWFFAFMGGFLGVLCGITRPERLSQPSVPVRGDVRTIVERR